MKPSCSNFRVIIANFLGVRIFRSFTVHVDPGSILLAKTCVCVWKLRIIIVMVLDSLFEPRHDKTNKMSVRPAKDQPGHPPSLIRVFAVRSMGS